MKRIVTILLVAVIAVAGVFAAKSVGDPDFAVGVTVGWDRVSGVDAVAFDTTIDHTVYTNDDFTVGVLTDFGLDLSVDGDRTARFTQFIGPVFTFKSVIPKTDIKAAVGVKMLDYTDFFDVGAGVDFKSIYWVADGFGVTLGSRVARLLKSNTNTYGVYIGLSCQL